MVNRFLYASHSYVPLQGNPKHQFAMRHAMEVYDSNAIYTLIPKNACSTIRVSLAIANGCIDSEEDINWIHANNLTFTPTLKRAANAAYTFTVLRCPFRRLVSVYLDKIVSKEPPAWKYRDAMKRRINLDDLSFSDFVNSLQDKAILNSDIHWRPQVDFLLFQEYSDYFSVEKFDEAIKVLKRELNLHIIDARKHTAHGVDGLELDDRRNYSSDSAFDISVLKRNGKCPSHSSMYSDDLIEQVKELYRRDIKLYKSKCDPNNLLFV